jgi:hypothetical protein
MVALGTVIGLFDDAFFRQIGGIALAKANFLPGATDIIGDSPLGHWAIGELHA